MSKFRTETELFVPRNLQERSMWTFRNHSKELAHSVVQLESVISERTAQLQKLSQRLLKVQDEERRKLARDLHDSTGQTLAALKLTVSSLQEKCQQDHPSSHFLRCRRIGRSGDSVFVPCHTCCIHPCWMKWVSPVPRSGTLTASSSGAVFVCATGPCNKRRATADGSRECAFPCAAREFDQRASPLRSFPGGGSLSEPA